MKTAPIIAIVVVILLVLGGVYVFMHKSAPAPPDMASSTPITSTPTNAQTVTTPSGVAFGYTAPYALATTPEQVLVKSYIPSCEEGFDYCIYRTGTQYADTNFESAGVAVKERKDLTSQQTCLTTQPSGYTRLHATTTMEAGYGTSVIGPLGDAGAGHYSNGSEYRLWTGSTCMQFDTRIGETQFANYPVGTKTLFADSDRQSVMGELKAVLSGVAIGNTRVQFP